ncbi:hypothetical protein KACC15558_28230 [Brevibacterium ammoniilyticum]|uniref:Uncharacterized protein n=2 Tax=Brevibacterium ammoniilyticum TaxID=1046555 RepID=A0ABP9U3I8_9MICO
MDFQTAVEIVTADQNENDWGEEGPMSQHEAVEHVRNTMSLDEVVDYGDENTEAYRLILSTTTRTG